MAEMDGLPRPARPQFAAFGLAGTCLVRGVRPPRRARGGAFLHDPSPSWTRRPHALPDPALMVPGADRRRCSKASALPAFPRPQSPRRRLEPGTGNGSTSPLRLFFGLRFLSAFGAPPIPDGFTDLDAVMAAFGNYRLRLRSDSRLSDAPGPSGLMCQLSDRLRWVRRTAPCPVGIGWALGFGPCGSPTGLRGRDRPLCATGAAAHADRAGDHRGLTPGLMAGAVVSGLRAGGARGCFSSVCAGARCLPWRAGLAGARRTRLG